MRFGTAGAETMIFMWTNRIMLVLKILIRLMKIENKIINSYKNDKKYFGMEWSYSPEGAIVEIMRGEC